MAKATFESKTLTELLRAQRESLPLNANPLHRCGVAIEWLCRRVDEQQQEIDRLKDRKGAS
jgi:hypothetical protein